MSYGRRHKRSNWRVISLVVASLLVAGLGLNQWRVSEAALQDEFNIEGLERLQAIRSKEVDERLEYVGKLFDEIKNSPDLLEALPEQVRKDYEDAYRFHMEGDHESSQHFLVMIAEREQSEGF